MKHTTGIYPRLKVDTAGSAAVGQAGGVLLVETVRTSGIDRGLSTALAAWRKPRSDGTPRVVPIWFHWDGENIVVASRPKAPKLKVLGSRPEVAVTIDTDAFPYRVLSIRGRAEMDMLGDVAPEYAAKAERYMGEQQGQAWVTQLVGSRWVEFVSCLSGSTFSTSKPAYPAPWLHSRLTDSSSWAAHVSQLRAPGS